MIEPTDQIKKFISENFMPATIDNCSHKLTSLEFLQLLFSTFPKDSIDDYHLYDILINLGYSPQKDYSEKDSLSIVWCLKDLSSTKI